MAVLMGFNGDIFFAVSFNTGKVIKKTKLKGTKMPTRVHKG